MNRPNGRRKKRATPKKIRAAAALAAGKSAAEAAQEAGYKAPSSVYRAQRELLQVRNMDDVVALRIQALDRLDVYRRKLCRVAGIIDHEDPEAPKPPPKPTPTSERNPTKEEIKAWEDECAVQGFDKHGDPFSQCENAGQVTMAIARLIALEQRRARLLGLDAPKIVAQVNAKSVRQMNLVELTESLQSRGMEIPPGLVESLRKRLRDPSTPIPAMIVKAQP